MQACLPPVVRAWSGAGWGFVLARDRGDRVIEPASLSAARRVTGMSARCVPVGRSRACPVWFRLPHALPDEASMAPSVAGLAIWRPWERLAQLLQKR
jgi:hypothetical protein